MIHLKPASVPPRILPSRLSATFTAHLVSVANKELMGTLSPLDATLTKNTGGPLPFLKFHFNFHSPSQPRGSFSTESAGPSAGSNSRCTPDPASSSCRTTDPAAPSLAKVQSPLASRPAAANAQVCSARNRPPDAAAAPPGSSPPLVRSLTAAIHRCCTSSATARTSSCAGLSPS